MGTQCKDEIEVKRHVPKEWNMNDDQLKGRVDEAAGKAKKTAGKVVGNDSLKNRGRVEEAAGKVRATYGDAKSDLEKDKNDLERDWNKRDDDRTDRTDR